MGRSVTNMGQDKNTNKHELKKHAATIHCSNTLSLLQRKISNALLYHAYPELMSKEEHEITIKQLCKLIAYQGHNHAAIKQALKGLITTVIEWNLINDETGTEDWTASSIIASVSLQGPLCYYAYSPRMKQLLHSPSMFGKINLVIQSRFRSSYGLALYENCTRYRGLPYTKWFDMELFKKLMGLEPGKYDIFRDFKRRVLDKAVEEINTYSDIVIKPEIHKEGRRATRIRFLLKEREKKARLGMPVINEGAEQGLSLQKKLHDTFGLSMDQVRQVLAEYEEKFILDKMTLVESSNIFQQGKVRNLAGYFISALQNDYQPPRTTKQEQTMLEWEESFEQKKIIQSIKKQFALYREQTLDTAIQILPEDQKTRFLSKFQEFAAPTIQTILRLQRNKYSQDTVLQSPQIKALLRHYAERELGELKLCSLEEFVATLPEDERAQWRLVHSEEEGS